MLLILVAALSEEERAEVEKLFAQHKEYLYRIAARALNDGANAEDAVSEAFLKIIDHVDTLSRMDVIKKTAFCVTVVKNTALDMLRKESKVSSVNDPAGLIYGAEPDFAERLAKEEEIRFLTCSLESLSKEDRRLLHLRYGEKMTYGDIGKLLDISEEAAQKRGRRLVEKLQGMYEDRENWR